MDIKGQGVELEGEPEEVGGVSIHKLRLLEALEEEPQIRQMDLAVRLGVAIGTVNWHLKRLAAKGYIKVKRIGRWRWSYILTPKGLAEKARLTRAYIEQSMQLYRETRAKAQELLREVRRAGYDRVRIEGELGAGTGTGNDLVDVCRLTCLEQGIKAVSSTGAGEGEPEPEEKGRRIPTLRVEGRELILEWPEEEKGEGEGKKGKRS